jgi:acyl CoA:acetate/3-ketoacid CoA transferase beta subunit
MDKVVASADRAVADSADGATLAARNFNPLCATAGAAFFDSALSFGMVRPGRIDVTPGGPRLAELAPGVGVEQVRAATAAPLLVPADVRRP